MPILVSGLGMAVVIREGLELIELEGEESGREKFLFDNIHAADHSLFRAMIFCFLS